MMRPIQTFWESTVVDGVDFLEPTASGQLRARMLIQCYYVFVFFVAFRVMEGGIVNGPYNYTNLLALPDFFEPVWATRWIPTDHWELAIRSLCAGFFVTALLTALLWERFAPLRILNAAFLFVFVALIMSFGRPSHEFHALMLAGCMLVFLPRDVAAPESGRGVVQVVFGVQTFLLLAYASSGVWKFLGFTDQILNGQTSAWALDAMARSASSNLINHGAFHVSFGYDFLVSHPSRLWSLLLIAGYALEFFSMYVIFRPHLFKLWGIGLVLLHVGNVLLVGPTFPWQTVVVLLFIVLSPLSPPVRPLQLLDGLRHALYPWAHARARQVVIYYDGQCLMCNGFLRFLSRFDLPDTWLISTIQSARYQQLLVDKAGLRTLDAIVVTVEGADGRVRILTKAAAVTWALARVHRGFLLLRGLYRVVPFLSSVVYDAVAANRTRVAPEACPVPPARLAKHLDRG